MRYQEPNKDIANDITNLVEEDDFAEEFVPEDPSTEPMRKLKPRPSNSANLNARRAIEERLERLRLRREIDYLFDEDFSEDDK